MGCAIGGVGGLVAEHPIGNRRRTLVKRVGGWDRVDACGERLQFRVALIPHRELFPGGDKPRKRDIRRTINARQAPVLHHMRDRDHALRRTIGFAQEGADHQITNPVIGPCHRR